MITSWDAWEIAAAVWPGAFDAPGASPQRDRQIEAGLGEWPLVGTPFKALGIEQYRARWGRTSWLRGLVLRPTGPALDDLWWRYDDTKIALGTRVNRASKAGRNAHALPALRAGFTTITDGHAHLGQSRFGDHLPALARLRVGRACPPDLGALDELVKAGRVREPSLAFPGWVALGKHRKRVERIVESYGPQAAGDLPLFAGSRR